MTGTLFVVSTPIGNLDDITLRALRTLREVDVVAAEDTRHTRKLFRHYQIATPLVSLHEHNERARTPEILDRLRSGQSVALVSDAGTPGISDPGALLVRAVRDAGLPVIPVPGPSTITAALSVAGVTEAPVSFLGFAPIRSKDRKAWFERVAALSTHALIFFEAPHRLRRTLEDLRNLVERPILIGREISKMHEEWRVGTPAALLEYFREPRGEFVAVIQPEQSSRSTDGVISDSDILALFGQLTNNRAASRRDAVRSVAKQLNLPVRAVYAAIERSKT